MALILGSPSFPGGGSDVLDEDGRATVGARRFSTGAVCIMPGGGFTEVEVFRAVPHGSVLVRRETSEHTKKGGGMGPLGQTNVETG